jgi:uncharacterized membrane protein
MNCAAIKNLNGGVKMQNEIQTHDNSFTPQNWAVLVWGLLLAGFVFLAIAPLAAIIIAYVQKNRFRGTPFYSHMYHAIFTFWIATIAQTIVGIFIVKQAFQMNWEYPSTLSYDFDLAKNYFIGAALCLSFVVLWYVIRSIKGLVLALDGTPYKSTLGVF